MSCWKIYRYNKQVLIPKMVLSAEGAFVEVNPVLALPISDPDAIAAVLEKLLAGEPESASPDDLNDPDNKQAQPPILEYLGLKLWTEFEKKALMYTLFKAGQELQFYVTGRGGDGMWSLAGSEKRDFKLSEEQELKTACRSMAFDLVSREPQPAPRILGLPGPKS